MKRTLRAALGAALALLLALPAAAQNPTPRLATTHVHRTPITDSRMVMPEQRNPPRRVRQPSGRTRAIVATAIAGMAGVFVAVFCSRGSCRN